MRIRAVTAFLIVALSAALLAAGLAGAASKRPTGPTAAQIRAAVRRAERSPYLWATVNICNTRRYPDTIGIRAQMPGLGLAAQREIDVQIQYYSDPERRFKDVPGAFLGNLGLASAAHDVRQTGARFRLTPPPPGKTFRLRGVVTFEWRRHGKLLGRAVRPTGHGYKQVAFGDPPGYSAGSCTLH